MPRLWRHAAPRARPPAAAIIAAALWLLLGHLAAAQYKSATSAPIASPQQIALDPAEMFALGEKYYWGRGVPIDWGAAAYWYAEAAEKRQPEATTRLALMYRRGEAVAYDKPKALDLLHTQN